MRVSLFGEKAEDLVAKLTKGAQAYCEGKLTLNTWQTAEGAECSGLNLLAWTVQPVGIASIGRRDPGSG